MARGEGRASGSRPPTSTGSTCSSRPTASTPPGRSCPTGRPPSPAACHVGPNATFGERDRTVEAHLIGFDGDLYGQTIELDFLDRLRPSRKFDGLEELLTQVRADVERARAVCSLDDL